MPQWGPNQDQTFAVATGALTSAFAANTRTANLHAASRVSIYVKYPLVGTEDMLVIEVKFAPKSSPTDFFFPTVVDNSTGVITVIPPFNTTVASMYSINLNAVPREVTMTVSVRAPVPGATPGAVTLFYETDNKVQGFGTNK